MGRHRTIWGFLTEKSGSWGKHLVIDTISCGTKLLSSRHKVNFTGPEWSYWAKDWDIHIGIPCTLSTCVQVSWNTSRVFPSASLDMQRWTIFWLSWSANQWFLNELTPSKMFVLYKRGAQNRKSCRFTLLGWNFTPVSFHRPHFGQLQTAFWVCAWGDMEPFEAS